MNSSTESNPITGPGIPWVQQWVLAHFNKVAAGKSGKNLMIPHVNSLDEAEDWFLSNASGSVCCVRSDGAELVANCWPDAKAFYQALRAEKEPE